MRSVPNARAKSERYFRDAGTLRNENRGIVLDHDNMQAKRKNLARIDAHSNVAMKNGGFTKGSQPLQCMQRTRHLVAHRRLRHNLPRRLYKTLTQVQLLNIMLNTWILLKRYISVQSSKVPSRGLLLPTKEHIQLLKRATGLVGTNFLELAGPYT